MGGRVKDRGESKCLVVMIRIAAAAARATALTSAWSFGTKHLDDGATNRNSLGT